MDDKFKRIGQEKALDTNQRTKTVQEIEQSLVDQNF
jgi:hypothetical protein